VNAPLVTEQRRYRELTLVPAARGLERLLLREADAVVVPSAALREHVLRLAPRRRMVRVVPNGVDLDLFEAPRAILGMVPSALEDRFVVAFVGSLKPWHGIEVLARAFEHFLRKVPEAHLLVIGDGPMRDYLKRVARRLGTDAVTLTGPVPHAEVPAWLSRAHVGVAPYPEIDGFYFSPLKIFEYMAAGLPVVASNIGQIPDLVQEGRTGHLVPPGRVRPLAEALVRLSREAGLRVRMARRARRRARTRHGWDRVAEKIEKLLERCRERGPRRKAGSR
jgi:glycosyltransferase involved in cell wall biosynthesis